MIRCASAGVSLLHVAGSLRLSYTCPGNVSYTLRLLANVRRFAGAVAARCVSVGGEGASSERTGAELLSAGREKTDWESLEWEAVAGVSSASEAPGESPLAWQGSQLSRVIAALAERSTAA